MLNRFARFVTVFSLLLYLSATPLDGVAAQQPGATAAPQREQLLNGLPILVWPQPGEPKVLLRLRINSGTAFDLAGKDGMTQLLADTLFPDPTTRQYVAEELEGRLHVSATYDYLDISLSGRASDFERLVELLRNAVVNIRLGNEEVTRLRDERVKQTQELSAAPTWQADRAIKSRLYGEYPYGRLPAGTPETLARAARPDLMLARDRFIHPNNSTLIVIGGVERNRALRAFRQFLGAWRKGDAIVPASFRQPETPATSTLLIDLPGSKTSEVRLAVRGLSRADRDQTAARLLALIAGARWQAIPGNGNTATARHDAHALGGALTLSAAVDTEATLKTFAAGREVLQNLAAATPATTAELEKAKQTALAELSQRRAQDSPSYLAEQWLDAATYGLPANYDEAQAINSVTTADAQRVAARLLGNAPPVSVVVGDAARLREEFSKLPGGIETPGTDTGVKTPTATTSPPPAKRP